MNCQPVEFIVRDGGEHLDVHSIFRTIQGEGPFAGRAAIFIRLAGCNLQCPACDTDYTTDRFTIAAHALVEQVRMLALDSDSDGPHLVVITGGEPFRQDIRALLALLTSPLEQFVVQIESNGTLPPLAPAGRRYGSIAEAAVAFEAPSTNARLFLIVSPKTGTVAPAARDAACAYKYVIRCTDLENDGLPQRALEHPAKPRLARPPNGMPVYVQPCDEQHAGRNSDNQDAAIHAAMKFGFIFQQQLHKQIGMP